MIAERSQFDIDTSKLRGANVSATNFGYDAAESTNRRRAPKSVLQAEDGFADKTKRRRLIATTQDLRRNFSIARWMINKHIDFVVSHNFKARTGDKDFDKVLENFVKHVSKKERFDARGMHPRRRWMRIAEAGRTIDGDMFGLKIRGGFLQGVESDRVRDPGKRRDGEVWTHGVLKGVGGSPKKYAIHRRKGTRFALERVVSAPRVIPFGYFDRFDQTRGVSPMASAIRDLGDVYEGFDYALAREKLNQLLVFAISRDSQDSFFETDGDNVTTSSEPYNVDFGKGPSVLDLDPGDEAKFLTPYGTPDQTQKFWDTVIAIALKSLDIPFSFFREDFTNFFGSRAALMLYLKSVKDKRLDVVEFLDQWLIWRIQEAEANGELILPDGFDPCEACEPWQWMPDGVAWWNPKQEVDANIAAVNNAQRSRQEIRREQFGDDWFDVVDQLAEEQEYLSEKSIAIPETTAVPSFTLEGTE